MTWRSKYYQKNLYALAKWNSRSTSVLILQKHQGDKSRYISSEFDQFVKLRIKTNKTDVNNSWLLYSLGQNTNEIEIWLFFCKLYFKYPKLSDAQHFDQTKKQFTGNYLMDILKSCFAKWKIDIKNYSDHNLWFSIAHFLWDRLMLHKSIQIN